MLKGHKRLTLILGVFLLAACLGVGGFLSYQNRFAAVGETRYEKTIESIDLSGQSVLDLTQLQAFSQLKEINLQGTGLTCGDFETVKAWFPKARILWEVPFQGKYYAPETDSLTITSLSEEDLGVLPYFTELKSISAEECPDYKILHDLRQLRPDLEIHYRVSVNDALYSYDVTELTLSGADAEELGAVIPFLTELETVKLNAPLAPAESLAALEEAFPDIRFFWELEVAGLTVDNTTQELDLTGIPVTVEEMDAVLPYLTSLTYVDMTDCGISNEEMELLNNRYENIRIVWTVVLGRWYRIRTDATSFMPVKDGFYPTGNDLYNLRYCHDIIAIDVGHRTITNIDFVAYMPHLKFLLMCETYVQDLTPLTGLTELIYLEIFLNDIRDLSPLVTLTALEDLNMHYVRGDPQIIAQMTWLKNLWWGHSRRHRLTEEQQDMLREAIPGCNFNFSSPSSTGEGWRELPNYYAQRDIFGLYYMKG